jgi:hypothetical protein
MLICKKHRKVGKSPIRANDGMAAEVAAHPASNARETDENPK